MIRRSMELGEHILTHIGAFYGRFDGACQSLPWVQISIGVNSDTT